MPQKLNNGVSYDVIAVVNPDGSNLAGGSGGGGDASAANQVTGNNSLASIDSKIPALAGGRQPVTTELGKAEDAPHVSGDIGVMHLGVRQDVDTSPVSADGDYHALLFNSIGRAKVSVKPGASVAVTGTITTAASVVFINVARESNVTVSLNGTFAGVNASFEWSPDSTTGADGNWYPVQAARSNGGATELTTGVLSATPAYNWRLNVNGATFFRVRATAYTSGTANVVIQPAAFATEPAPTLGALPAGANTIGGVFDRPQTSGGCLVGKIASLASTNATSLKASAGQFYAIQLTNTGAAAAYFKLYNKATAPTVGTDTTVEIIGIPAGGSREINRPLGGAYSLGIAYAITAGAADTDTAAIAANQVVGSLYYF